MAIANDDQHEAEIPDGEILATRGGIEDEPTAPRVGRSIHPALAAAFSALDAVAVDWAVLRGAADGTDDEVDLFAAAPGAVRLRTALTAVGFLPLPAIGHTGHRFFRAYDEATDRWFTLDVVADLAFGVGRSLVLEISPEALLARRLDKGNESRLAPDDEFWMLILHDLLDRASIPDAHADRLALLMDDARGDGPIGRAIDSLAGTGTAERLISLVASGDRAAVLAAGPRLRRRWTRVDLAGVLRRRAGHWILARLRKPFTALRRPGIGVTILGPDGAGKSTLAETLRTGFPTPTRTIYLGLYGGGLAGGGLFGLLRRLGRLWRGWLVGRWHRWRGRLVVYDRHALDARVPGRRGGASSRIRRWLLAHAIPSPELIIVLDAPAEVLFARKAEHDVATLEAQRRGYLEIARGFPSAQVVDAERDADLVRREVTSRTWRRLAQGYRGG
jgi:thymidylate kinase